MSEGSSRKVVKQPAIFIDRDGTLNEEVDYLCRPEDTVLTPRAGQAIAGLNKRGIPVLVISNQAGIGKGKFEWKDYESVMQHLDHLLAAEGARIDGVYVCPFHPSANEDYRHPSHPDRKPNPGMLLRAADEHGIDLAKSWMIGDKTIDLEAGRNAGCRVALVRTGYGTVTDGALADLVADNLADAIERILGQWD
ncbi:MAG: HAD family hydrolase [Holophaga sp.]|nr:HAD family hydrolase [Holophaga sp.]